LYDKDGNYEKAKGSAFGGAKVIDFGGFRLAGYKLKNPQPNNWNLRNCPALL